MIGKWFIDFDDKWYKIYEFAIGYYHAKRLKSEAINSFGKNSYFARNTTFISSKQVLLTFKKVI